MLSIDPRERAEDEALAVIRDYAKRLSDGRSAVSLEDVRSIVSRMCEILNQIEVAPEIDAPE